MSSRVFACEQKLQDCRITERVRFRSFQIKPSVAALLFAALFCFTCSSRAAIIFDNLTGSTDGDALSVDFDVKVALGFDIVSTETGDWSFSIRANYGGGSAPGALVLQLVGDTAGNPNTTPVISLSGGPVGGGLYTFTGSGTLNASTRYWLVASSAGGTGDFWDWIDRGPYTTQTGATLGGVRQDLGDGFGWQSVITDVHPLSLQIDLTPVPEPAETGAIAALCLIAFSLAHTFRGRASSALRKLFS